MYPDINGLVRTVKLYIRNRVVVTVVGLPNKKNLSGNTFSVKVLDSTVEDILWLQLNGIDSDFTVCVAVCYLSPEGFTRPNEPDSFFENLLNQVYCYQNLGETYIFGDVNARCGTNSDFIEGVDDIQFRDVIDETENHYGDLFADFLVISNFALLNGRIDNQFHLYISERKVYRGLCLCTT